MNTYTAKQQQLDRLRREQKRFIKEMNSISRFLSIDNIEYVKSYEVYEEEQKSLIDNIERLRLEYNVLEDKKQMLKRNMLDDNNIDIVKFIVEGSNPAFEVEELFKLGVLSVSHYEYVKDYLWKNRASMKYKLQTTYYQDDKETI